MEDILANDPRADVQTVNTSTTSIVITVISASVSVCASTLIMWYILRSTKGLRKSVYHRILFSMSVSDIIQSIAMALTTLPMPVDMIYDFHGLVLGNQASCQAQGFFVTLGSVAGMMFNAMLSIYYLCSIKYDMMDNQFRKCLEPCLHALSILAGVGLATLFVLADSYHPSPVSMPWCGPNLYPFWCEDDCMTSLRTSLFSTSIIIGAVCFIAVITSMVAITLKVRQQKKKDKSGGEPKENRSQVSSLFSASDNKSPAAATDTFAGTNANIAAANVAKNDTDHAVAKVATSSRKTLRTNLDEEDFSPIVSRSTEERLRQNRNIIIKQATTYTVINLVNIALILIFPIVRNFAADSSASEGLQTFWLVIRPLQGFFNAIIFISHKTHSFLRHNSSMRFCTALMRVLKGEESPERAFSDILIVTRHSAMKKLNFAGNLRNNARRDANNPANEARKLSSANDNRIRAHYSICASHGGGFSNSESGSQENWNDGEDNNDENIHLQMNNNHNDIDGKNELNHNDIGAKDELKDEDESEQRRLFIALRAHQSDSASQDLSAPKRPKDTSANSNTNSTIDNCGAPLKMNGPIDSSVLLDTNHQTIANDNMHLKSNDHNEKKRSEHGHIIESTPFISHRVYQTDCASQDLSGFSSRASVYSDGKSQTSGSVQK